MPAKLSKEEYRNRVHELNPHIELLTDYTSSHEPIIVKCKNCKMSWSVLACSMLKKSRCEYCSGKKPIIGKTDLLTKRPDIASEWDYENNGELRPEHCTVNSHEYVNWRCRLGHKWPAYVYNRTREDSGCPVCQGKRVEKGFNDLASQRSDLMQQWDWNRNTLNPEEVYYQSHDYAWWICPMGHSWSTRIHLRSQMGYGCPKCDKSGTSFAEQAFYYYLKQYFPSCINGYTELGVELDIYIPEYRTAIEYDGKRYHSGERKIKSDNEKDQFCQANNIRLIRVREKGLPQSESAITVWREEPDKLPTLNQCISSVFNVLGISDYCIDIVKDSIKIWNSYYAYLKQNNLQAIAPDIAKEWHPTKNGSLTPSMVTKGFHGKVYWICKNHPEHVYPATISNRLMGRNCPYCGNRKIWRGFNDLETKNPELAKSWSPNNPVLPSDVFPNSHTNYLWICSAGHEYPASPANRMKGKGCPYCSNQKVLPGYNDLKTKYPEIAKEWDYSKNKKGPDEVVCGTAKKFFWICPNGHSYDMAVNKRVHGQGCRYCSNNSVLSGVNDLAHLRKDLMEQWDFEKNTDIDPKMTALKSNKLVYWKCKCCGKGWPARIYHRTVNPYARCKYCNNIIYNKDM